MIIHGNALLSLVAGVPANFVMFYIIGWIAKRSPKSVFSRKFSIMSAIVIGIIFLVGWYIGTDLSLTMASIFLFFGVLSILLLALFEKYWHRWRIFALASIIGNAAGSLLVGLGVWAFSQFFILPGTLGHNLPFTASMIWFTWTFSNQMPFLLVFCPPILKICQRIFPHSIEQLSN